MTFPMFQFRATRREAGERIRVRISTRTESGVMEVTLLDEAGAVVYSFGSATYQELTVSAVILQLPSS